MKILLANPPCRIPLKNGKERYFVRAGSRWPFSVIKTRQEPLEYLPFPFYLAYTASLLLKSKLETEVLDSITLNHTENEFLTELLTVNPDILLFESTTPTIENDYKLVKRIKKKLPHLTICLSGPHVSVFPKEVLRECPEIDYIFIREYEINFRDFCLNFHDNKNLAKITGIAYKKKNQYIIQLQKDNTDINKLPPPALDLFPNREKHNPTLYWDGFCQNKPAIQMNASRGCPFRCNFCLWNQVMYQNGKYRTFSPKRIVTEMKSAQEKYGAREIYFDDDTFTGSKSNVLAICQEIKQRKLNIKWSAMADAMITDKEMINQMALSGCIGLKFGVESGNQAILKHIEKPLNLTRLQQFTSWCAQRHIKTHATFTFGLSGETKESMEQTLSLAKSLDIDSVQFSLTTPFPGTRYYDEVKTEKRLRSTKWLDFDGANSSIICYPQLSNEEVTRFCKKASGRWLRHKMSKPYWLYRQSYNLRRLIAGQGISIVKTRLFRLLALISQ